MDAGVAAGQGIWEGNMSCSRQSCLQVCQKGRDNAMKGRTVTAGVNEHTWSKRGSERGEQSLQSTKPPIRSVLPPVFHIK